MLPLTHGEGKLALKDMKARVLFEVTVPELMCGTIMPAWVKRFEAMVATPIDVCFLLTVQFRQNWI